ncbi:MAG: hypothetical protein H7338_04110 [Candidatus Sericytochromatia bacterium]|nr:hypothetical protein [Candidatus Sericytochromatia bacterium]
MHRVFTSVVAITVMQTAWAPIAMAQHTPFDLQYRDKVLTPAEIAIQRYKRQRLSIRIDGDTWTCVQGINAPITDEQLLQMAGMGSRLKDQKTKDLYGGLITVSGALIGIFGILTLANIIPVGNDLRLVVGFSSLGLGIVTAAAGELLFPIQLPSDHFMTIDEARNATMVFNARTKADLGLPPETPD